MDKRRLANKIRRLIIQFDSSTAFLHALAYFFHSREFKAVGMAEGIPPWMGSVINSIPKSIRASLFSWTGWFDAITERGLSQINMEEVSQWAVNLYPEKKYSGFMFGSSNGSAIHLAAALGCAWLPQTYLVALRRFLPPDELKKDVEWGKSAIHKFLEENPDLLVHQMHDPVQDRLMVQKMGYFRIKRLKLGRVFENFIVNCRDKGAPMLVINCSYPWPAYKVSQRHLFQVGGYGGLEPYEYLIGTKKTSDFLKKMKSKLNKWESYTPTAEYPEAEWGFASEALPSIRQFAKTQNIPLMMLEFSHPEALSPFCCDLYEWWYLKRKMKPEKLLVENFGLLAPLDVMESASLPFWLAFNTGNSLKNAVDYINQHEKFKEIFLMLMSNGVTGSIGLVDISGWKSLLGMAGQKGDFIGVDEKQYPLDFATYLRYGPQLKEKLKPRSGLPSPLTFNELEEFMESHGRSYSLKLEKLN